MARPHIQRTRRPIPRSRPAWTRELGGIFKFFSQPVKRVDGTGGEWLRSIRGYYLERADDLIHNAPRSLHGSEELTTYREQIAEWRRAFSSQGE